MDGSPVAPHPHTCWYNVHAVIHTPWVLAQQRDDVELRAREVKRDASIPGRNLDRTLCIIDREVMEDANALSASTRRAAPHAPDAHARDRPAPRARTAWRIMVGAGSEPVELVDILHARRKENDRAAKVLANTAAKLEPVHAGHVHVEQGEVIQARSSVELQ